MNPDCLVILGHSIERISIMTTGGERIVWRPTRSFQSLKPNGFRTGFRIRTASPDDPNTVIGGGEAVTLAAVELFEELWHQGHPPALIIWAAGRPAYLDELAPDYPELCEALPMKELFDFLAPTGGTNTEAVILAKNRDTYDDVFVSLRTALERGVKGVAFLALKIRQERLRELVAAALEEYPAFQKLGVEYAVAEKLLRRRYLAFATTAAWRETEQRELAGAKALREKRYKRDSIYGGRY